MFIHETAICESKNIGEGTNIWAFAHILPGAIIGGNVNVCDGVFIENDVVVGDNVTIKCGVQIWDGITIENDVFIGPNVTFTNDIKPRSKQYPQKFMRTVVKKGASIGANATLLPGITIGQSAMVGAGSVVTQDVPPYATVVGNPAKIVNYNNTALLSANTFERPCSICDVVSATSSSPCKIITLPHFTDMRGSLVAVEHSSLVLPFIPQRTFLVFGVNTRNVRGEHAHKECEQVLVAASGEISVVVDDGIRRCEVRLCQPNQGLYIPCGVWGVQYRFSEDAVLMVYASHPYEDSDYIRDYEEFLDYVRKKTF